MSLCLIALILFAEPDLAAIRATLDVAERTYDAGAVAVSLEALDAVDAPSRDADWRAVRLRSLLLAAELERVRFEQLAASAGKERRELGGRIDAYAEAGLSEVGLLPETSESHRIKADLIGAMIRSNHRAGKMKGEMKSAIDAALRLDPGNAKAVVSRAKMLIFNPAATPADLEAGLELLEQALGLHPDLEQAALLQAHAWDQLGEPDKAAAIWRQCLQGNPECNPARRALQMQESNPVAPRTQEGVKP